MTTSLIQDILFQRLVEQERDNDEFALYVLAACEGQEALDQFIDGTRRAARPEPALPAIPGLGFAHVLYGIQVRSFRGIGERIDLKADARAWRDAGRLAGTDPGKSSFAEGVGGRVHRHERQVGEPRAARNGRRGGATYTAPLAPRIVVEMMQEGIGASRVERTWEDSEDSRPA